MFVVNNSVRTYVCCTLFLFCRRGRMEGRMKLLFSKIFTYILDCNLESRLAGWGSEQQVTLCLLRNGVCRKTRVFSYDFKLLLNMQTFRISKSGTTTVLLFGKFCPKFLNRIQHRDTFSSYDTLSPLQIVIYIIQFLYHTNSIQKQKTIHTVQ